MKTTIEGIEFEPVGFRPKEGAVYAIACERMDVFKATEYAHRFLCSVGIEPCGITTERFSFRRDASTNRLGKMLETLAMSSFPRNGAIVVLPGISKQELAPTGECDKADVLAFCLELRKQLEESNYPCFVPIQSVDLCVNRSWILDAMALVGFTTIHVWSESEDATPTPYMVGDWMAEEAASMVSFPDHIDNLDGEELP